MIVNQKFSVHVFLKYATKNLPCATKLIYLSIFSSWIAVDKWKGMVGMEKLSPSDWRKCEWVRLATQRLLLKIKLTTFRKNPVGQRTYQLTCLPTYYLSMYICWKGTGVSIYLSICIYAQWFPKERLRWYVKTIYENHMYVCIYLFI